MTTMTRKRECGLVGMGWSAEALDFNLRFTARTKRPRHAAKAGPHDIEVLLHSGSLPSDFSASLI